MMLILWSEFQVAEGGGGGGGGGGEGGGEGGVLHMV